MRNSRSNVAELLLVIALIIVVIGLSVNSNVGSVNPAGQGAARPSPTPPKKRTVTGGRSSRSSTPKPSPIPSPSPTPQQGFRPTNPKIVMVRIAPGTFRMGSYTLLHRVIISREFYLGKYEVTQAQWAMVMDTDPSRYQGDNLPVEQVSWEEVQEFIRRLNQMNLEFTYRLPTEAEWEYACRAGNDDDPSKEELEKMAWFLSNSGGLTHPVQTKDPNAFGLYHMLGNVWEWCQDFFDDDYYSKSPAVTDPPGPASGTERVVRGGSFDNGLAAFRCGFRISQTAGPMLKGFRVAGVRRVPIRP